ncbi:MAG: aminotransferase class V-fold PLP-dependent enzyme [Actinobacteria bacterium]|nr:MAG: aminotransferase class V-fold PLP-dependent enzyme [Actinomycetota bacterium]
MDITSARRLFPAAENVIYLNHASMSPSPVPVRDAMTGLLESLSAGRFIPGPRISEMRDEVARRAADLVGAKAARVALVRNTTHGILLASEGLPWEAGDNVVCANVEFPANVYPWLGLKKKGVEVRFAREVDGRIPLHEVARLVDGRTRVLALSFVEFTNGYRNDLVALGELCGQAGVLFVVDGIQGLGALGLDMREAGVDLLSAGGHKWLCGPMGIGIAALSERAMAEMEPAHVGWLSVRRPLEFLDYDMTLAPDAHRFEEGSPNLVGLAGLGAALGLILEIGIEKIERRVFELSGRLVEGLGRLGVEVASPRGEGEWSGIVSFRPLSGTAIELCSHLSSRSIFVSPRGELVRASCHYWNSEEDIDALLEALGDVP